jgi:putative ABC transport system ATP-binding protein
MQTGRTDAVPAENGHGPGLAVRARRVRKVYLGVGEIPVLRGVDLDVGRGESVAIVGPPGSGKTTLINCLAGLDRLDGGLVAVEGRDLSALSERERTAFRARHMGFVFQSCNLLTVLTAVESVEIPLLLVGVPAREARRRALEMLEVVGLAHRAQNRPGQLHAGEPTGNLDRDETNLIMELLSRVNRDGQTIVLATHNPHVAVRAGRVLRLRDGRLEPAPAASLPAVPV